MKLPVTIDTPLGADVLLFRSMKATEEMGRLFEYEVEMLSANKAIAFADVVGQRMTVHLQTSDSASRHFNGVVARFAHVGEVGKHALYRATLRPWLWLLTLRANCRMFQAKSVPDIIKDIFREHGLTDFSESLSGTYSACEYKVQYQETDFNFVSRLMEQAGIYYFFKHESSKHTLCLADAYSAHSTVAGYETVPYYPKQEHSTGRRERDHVHTWSIAEHLEAGAVVADDFDFTRPKAELQSKLVGQHTLAKGANEIYEFPGAYSVNADGDALVKVRLEQIYAQQEIAEAEGDVRGLAPGALFTLSGFGRSDQNREYLVVRSDVELSPEDYESGTGGESGGGVLCSCRFTAVPSQRPFRTRCCTPCPRVHGPQTAIVVGKSGEEAWTDEYGRVKLQFHWDRESKSDENSSCWVRVAQLWAGTKWGGIHVPRIGQEVVVEFIDGDPDRPLVTGRVYNADNMPPYTLPAAHTQSGIKSRSTKGGAEANFNELRFEDKKGEEQVYLQAEKNMDSLVKNDETLTVQHDRKKDITNDETTTVGGNRTETVKKEEKITIEGGRTEKVSKDESITIDGGRTEKVAKDESITIDGGRTEKVAKDESITIDGGRTEKVAKDESITIDGGRTEKVAKDESITISGGRTEKVAKDESISIDGGRTEKVAKDESITISGGRTVKVTKDETVTIDGARTVKITKDDGLKAMKIAIEGQTEITLKVGGTSIKISPSGVEIKGPMIKVEAQGMLDLKSSGMATLSGAMVQVG
jgi:type VI secretion system secreted protein VgrG